jgi:hypothetical protein
VNAAPAAGAWVLDHVFVCCAVGAPEADLLVRRGLPEGPPAAHPGQGTAGRRFFFGNAYLEFLWVSDPVDAKRDPRTGLWERWSRRHSGGSPFGIALSPVGDDVRNPPFESWTHRPGDLPEGASVAVANGTRLEEPAIFALPAARRPVGPDASLGRPKVVLVEVSLPSSAPLSAAAAAVQAANVVRFTRGSEHLLTIEVESGERTRIADFRPELPLRLTW